MERFIKKPAVVSAMKVGFNNLNELITWTGARISFESGSKGPVFYFSWPNQDAYVNDGDYLVADPNDGWIAVPAEDMLDRYEPVPEEPVEEPEIPEGE